MKYKDYPIGTKAYAVMEGYWIKTNRGWKWCTGDTFPTPGADVIRIELPNQQINSEKAGGNYENRHNKPKTRKIS